jgi:riboflavin kinase/FMN adenylyltransferase
MDRLTAVTIGNFDGVHLGHQSLIRAARRRVGPDGRVVALSFDPHPATVLAPGRLVERLSDFPRRTRWLVEAGADDVVRMEPTRQLLDQSPEQFIAGLVDRFKPAVVVEGRDFRFGKGRQGSIETLRRLGTAVGFAVVEVDTVEAVLSDHTIVPASSTMTRWLLKRGRVRDASKLLGRAYAVAGTVVAGEQRGREFGIPTANLDVDDLMLPSDAVYIGEAILGDGSAFRAAISVGTKPTFSSESIRTCEAHLLDFDGPCGDYGWPMELFFHDWLRDQVAFSAIEPLVEQIHRDIAHVRDWSMALEAVS